MEKKIYCPFVDKGLRFNNIKIGKSISYQVQPCCSIDSWKFNKKTEVTDSLAHVLLESSVLAELRKTFNNGLFHPACYTCEKNEKDGMISKRLDAINQENKDFDIYMIDISIGNTCNMACTICTPVCSSLIDRIKLKNKDLNIPENWKLKSPAKINNSKLSQELVNLIERKKVQKLKIIGGEPFLTENWYPIQEFLDTKSYIDVDFHITTNGSIINNKILNNISKFKSVYMRISVDSIGDNYNFLRWPFTWDKIEKNLDYLCQNCPENVKFAISVVATAYNFEYLPQILQRLGSYSNVDIDFWMKPEENEQNIMWLPDHMLKTISNELHVEKNKILSIKMDERRTDEILEAKRQKLTQTTRYFLRQRSMDPSCLGPMLKEWIQI